MVVNWVLRNHDVAELHRAVTVATPFYGYGGQVHRWFEGEPLFNGLGKDKIIRLICSMPACYSFQFMPEPVFTKNQAALAVDPSYPLGSYPSFDKTTNAVADPFKPTTNGGRHRYPSASASGFDLQELARAKQLVTQLAAPLPAPLARAPVLAA